MVEAVDVLENESGMLIYSTVGQAATPFQGGTLCISSTLRRTALQSSGSAGLPPCRGGYGFDFNTLIQSGSNPSLSPGNFVYAQYWYRDAGDPAGFGSGLSDAICFGIAP